MRLKKFFNMAALTPNWVYAVMGTLALSSCLSQFDDLKKLENLSYNWTPEVEVPIGKVDVKLADFLSEIEGDSSFIETDEETGLISFVYAQSIISQSAQDLFTIPDQLINTFIEMPDNPLLDAAPSVTATVDIPKETVTQTFNTDGGESLDALLFKAGTLTLSLNSSVEASGELLITFPSLKKDGVAFSKTLTWNYSGQPINLSEALDLTGYTIDLFDEASNQRNTFEFSTEGRLEFNDAKYNSNDEITIDIAVSQAQFKALYGYLGSSELASTADSLVLGGFDQFENGMFQLADPQLTMTMESSFGIPLGITLEEMTAVSASQGSVALSGQYANQQIVAESPSTPGEKVVTEIKLDNTTSNIAELLAIFPEKLEYAFSGVMNPGADPATTQNYILDDSRVDINVEARVPLYGTLTGLTQEIDMEIDSAQFELLQAAKVHLHTSNTLPVDIAIQIYFKDQNGTVLGSLFDESQETYLLKAAPVDAQGNVDLSNPNKNPLTVDISQDKLELLASTSKLTIELSIATLEEGTKDVKFTDQQGLGLDLSLEAILNQEVNF